MKKFLCITLVLVLVLFTCACTSAKLSDSFDKDEVITRSKEIVQTINTLDYDSIVALLREDLQSQLTAPELETAWGKQLTDAGAFESFKQETVVGTKSQTTDEDYAVAVLVCKYENSTLTYTMSFDTQLDLVGLYMK